MKKRNRVFLAALALAVIAGWLAWVALREPPEPVYKGRTISAWYQDYLEQTFKQNPPSISTRGSTFAMQNFIEAVNETGTNALSCLLEMLNRKDYSSLRKNLVAWANKHGRIFHHHFWTEDDRWWMEYNIIDTLARQTKTKTPICGFREIFEKATSSRAKCTIIKMLNLWAFFNYETVKPVILKALEDNDPEVRAEATNALKQIDTAAATRAGVK